MSIVRKNRFGEKEMIVALKPKKNPDFPQGYGEINGKLYKFTLSKSRKEGVDFWLNVVKTEKLDNTKGL